MTVMLYFAIFAAALLIPVFSAFIVNWADFHTHNKAPKSDLSPAMQNQCNRVTQKAVDFQVELFKRSYPIRQGLWFWQ